ncbi:DUF5085 domain-containing protein [Paenibacillus sambharensis]|uniref:DUF5085 domain-containing protein n=1 Tax=Paenibacillus sambharensis TaxID=1803190 RepID=A0A2W1LHP1_9BACL|nr:DUF5085 family protein [Paenibacillus sambharensis]PZD94572.1 DUF5085 domain-containing protein [Paenibacillus sambharensis]
MSVLTGDSIRHTNVLSQVHRFHYSEMDAYIRRFLRDVMWTQATIRGPFFYSLLNVPMDEVLSVEFFMPVEQSDVAVPEGMQFHSYFAVEDMMTYCVHTNFETSTEAAYKILLDEAEHRQLHQVTPFFHVFSGDRSLPYLMIKIGVAEGSGQAG